MHFCGQCGLQLPPGSTICPRCGAPVEPELVWEDTHTSDTTLPTQSAPLPNPPHPDYQSTITPLPSAQQQPLILRPDGSGYASDSQSAGAPTSMINRTAPATQTPVPPTQVNTVSSYPTNVPNIASNIPASNTPYLNYASQADASYQSMPAQYGAEPAQLPARRGKGHIVLLLIILFCLLGILAGMIYYFMTYILHKPASTLTPSQQAQAVITQYYQYVNDRNYQAAYDLWANKPLPYNQFVQGYAHTVRDDITVDGTTPMANGDVRVTATITATEQQAAGTMTSVYKGSYVISQVNGAWKILRGSLRRVG